MTTRRTLVGLLTAAAVAVPALPATADPGDGGASQGSRQAFPSKADVEAARAEAARTAQDVASIKAQLLMANQALADAAQRAEVAAEAYNGAMWRLSQAQDAVRRAEREAKAARHHVAGQRTAIARLVTATYRQGGELSAVSAVMGADGPEGVLGRFAAFQGASDSLQADYDRFAASDAVAQVFEDRARDARREMAGRAAEARRAKDAATAAATSAQEAATSVAAQKDQLISQLAQAQHISVALATQRQQALEEIARERAEAAARAAAEAAAKKAAAEQAARERAAAQRAAAEKAAAEKAAAQKAAARHKAARQEARHEAARAAARAEKAAAKAKHRAHRQQVKADAAAAVTQQAAAPAPAPAPSHTSTGGGGRRASVRAAISFAKAQLGEPYVWGAAGPDSWDCSGLTSGAWGAAGRYLPHYSVAQYDMTTHIGVDQLKPGDLLFWGTTSDPSSIHHVALYLGNGMMIHAPRTGETVSIESMYYWIPPNFFGRV